MIGMGDEKAWTRDQKAGTRDAGREKPFCLFSAYRLPRTAFRGF